MCTLIFGDSFARKFTLTKNNNIKVWGFSGATMKGLSRENDTSKKIREHVARNKKKLKCLIFSFGQVDLHHSYYYVKFHKKEKKFNTKKIVNGYLKFIRSLDVEKNTQIIVLSVYPSALETKYIYASLVAYEILTDEDFSGTKKATLKRNAQLKARVKRQTQCNTFIKKGCKDDIAYIDITPDITDEDGSLNEKFKDPGIINIHVRWEPTLPVLIKEINKINKCQMDTNFLLKLHKTDKAYMAAKKKLVKERVKNRFDKKLVDLEKYFI